MNNLYEVLEVCLQEIEKGADIETVLFHYPDLADELRPILETSVDARNMTVPLPSRDAIERGRAQVLRHAAQLRSAKVRSSQRIWFASFRRLAVTFVVLVALFASGTGLVRAASTTLPGDQLYPVKRTWEDVLVAFTFNVQQRDALEVEHENERIQEVHDVFAEGRSVKVEFAGSVTSQNGTEWVIANIPVHVSAQTEMRGQGIAVGSAVRVKGQTQGSGVVQAESIELLPSNAILPDVGDKSEGATDHQGSPTQQLEDNSGKGSGEDSPQVEATQSSDSNLDSGKDGSNVISTDTNSNEGSHNGSDSNSTNGDGNYNSTDGSGGDGSSSHE